MLTQQTKTRQALLKYGFVANEIGALILPGVTDPPEPETTDRPPVPTNAFCKTGDVTDEIEEMLSKPFGPEASKAWAPNQPLVLT